MLAVASVVLFVRGYGAAQTGEIMHDKMGRSSTGNQQMLVWGVFFAIAVAWAAWLIIRDRARD
jgi:hypothetical protein